MNTKEKMLMVQLILEDIRGNWAYDAEERALKAMSLCEEIANETGNKDFLLLADFCDVYISTSKKLDDWDGRFFRNPFPRGYEDIIKMHKLKPTYKDKSKDFKTVAIEYLTYPSYRFDDWVDETNDEDDDN